MTRRSTTLPSVAGRCAIKPRSAGYLYLEVATPFMTDWIAFEPPSGWAAFTESMLLTASLWERLPATDWHYLNFALESSIWESRQDGSTVRVHYGGDRLVELAVTVGIASNLVGTLASRFQLAPVSSPI